MTYVASVIGSNPDHYWRLNEGAGATATLDYGNAPGMLWPAKLVTGGITYTGRSGFGYGGITADGGAMECCEYGLWSTVPPPSTVLNRYVSLPDPGTLELWWFHEDSATGAFVGWFAPNASVGQQNFGLQLTDNTIVGLWLTGANTSTTISPLSQWHHIAASWANGTGFVYLDGTQASPFSYVGNVAGGRVYFMLGPQLSSLTGDRFGGLVSEVATYRRALTVGDLDTHFNQAELKGQRPHWIGQRQTTSSAPVEIARNYTVGVTHVARSGSGSFSVPTGLRGFKIDLIPPFPPGRTSPGTPTYLWDVGWVSILDANGMLAERRPNRDTTVWLPDQAPLATVFTHDLNPGWTIDVSELDPA